MEDLRIVGWADFDCDYPTRAYQGDELMKIVGLIANEISENDYVFAGQDHQSAMTGVPVFSDGTCFRASWRFWGMIMALVYSGPNGEELSYMDFYMSLDDNCVLPEESDIDVEPADIDNISPGYISKEDGEILQQVIESGNDFLTYDVVLQRYVALLKKD